MYSGRLLCTATVVFLLFYLCILPLSQAYPTLERSQFNEHIVNKPYQWSGVMVQRSFVPASVAQIVTISV